MAAAYAISTGIRWRLRHIETKRNPADRDSRFLERKSMVPRVRQVHDRGKKSKIETGAFVPDGGCRSSSEGGDPCQSDRWCSKLEEEERRQLSGRTKTSAQTLSMKLSGDLNKDSKKEKKQLGLINRGIQPLRSSTDDGVEARLHEPGALNSTIESRRGS